MSDSPVTVIATYRVQSPRVDDFMALLRDHWPTLRELDLVTTDEPVIYRGHEKGDSAPIVFEIFTWKNAEAPGIAHQTPDVAKVWEAMGPLCEARDGKPMFEFPHVERVTIDYDR